MDSNLRNVVSQASNQISFHDADVRIGMRTSSDLLNRWNPTGRIMGVAFKDLNKDGIYEMTEPVMPDITIKVGKQGVKTNSMGIYRAKVDAQKVKVQLIEDSIPTGFQLTTPLSKNIVIKHNQVQFMDFGFSVQTNISGVIFYDKNNNGKFDVGEEVIPNAKIILDQKDTLVTDYTGSYNFSDLQPGQHTIQIDVNSLPMDYLPAMKLKNEIEVSEGESRIFNIPLKK